MAKRKEFNSSAYVSRTRTGPCFICEMLAGNQPHHIVYQDEEAVRAVVPCERLYLISLGSQQGNRHVHWHIVPCPPGVPYHEQQTEAISTKRGILDLSEDEMGDLADRIRAEL